MKKINYQTKISYGKLFAIEVDPKYGKVYYKFFRVPVDGFSRRMAKISFKKPRAKMVNAYRKLKDNFCKQF